MNDTINKSNLSIIDYHIDYIQKYLTSIETIESDINKIIQIHTDICTKIDTIQNIPQKIEIIELEFNNMLCYGKNNHIDFTKFKLNEHIGIISLNETGKTALVNIILFSLFGKNNRGDPNDTDLETCYGDIIMNYNETKMDSSLTFRIDTKTYLIKRNGVGDKTKNQILMTSTLYELDIKKNKMIEIKNIDIEKTITDLIGSYEHFVTTNVYTQNGFRKNNTKFFEMTQNDKKKYINNLLKIDVFSLCRSIAKNIKINMENTHPERKNYIKYINMIQKNNLPDFILKDNIRKIETNANLYLKDIVDFDIEFKYDKKNKIIADVKKNGFSIVSSNYAGFLGEVALKMACNNISCHPKYNLFIIDGYWDGMYEKIVIIKKKLLDVIETQCDHPIILSHSKPDDLQCYQIAITKNIYNSNIDTANI